jgi:Coenzyme PQQ synthesis protein D (PqqD)
MGDPFTEIELTRTTIMIPDHVVFRTFAAETVILNVQTGQYHGLNTTAGSMLEALQRTGELSTAARELAAELSQPSERIERDLRTLCESLRERGLIEISDRSEA